MLEGFASLVGKTVASLALNSNALSLVCGDGTKATIADQGHQCCERRYMRTDDDLSDLVGAELRSAEIRDTVDLDDPDGESHQVQFLVLQTSKGDLTLANHNEHNGYYGGFDVELRIEQA